MGGIRPPPGGERSGQCQRPARSWRHFPSPAVLSPQSGPPRSPHVGFLSPGFLSPAVLSEQGGRPRTPQRGLFDFSSEYFPVPGRRPGLRLRPSSSGRAIGPMPPLMITFGPMMGPIPPRPPLDGPMRSPPPPPRCGLNCASAGRSNANASSARRAPRTVARAVEKKFRVMAQIQVTYECRSTAPQRLGRTALTMSFRLMMAASRRCCSSGEG